MSPSEPADIDAVTGPIFIEETSVDIYKEGQSFSTTPIQDADWVVNVSLALRSSMPLKSTTLTLGFPELKLSKSFQVTPSAHASSTGPIWVNAIWKFSDSIPERWYPHNLGSPKLYNLTGTLEEASHSITFNTRTGFRTIQLVQSAYTSKDIAERGITPGDQWHFEVNGKAFYSLGTNIIPFDILYARTTTDQVRWVLESAVKSGQNMVCNLCPFHSAFPRLTDFS